MLASIKHHDVRNVVWVTADVHYAAAHHYDPGRAAFTEFDPFWELVAGPINAGTFVEAALVPNQPPTDGRQYYGVVDATRDALHVQLRNITGTTLFSTSLDASGS